MEGACIPIELFMSENIGAAAKNIECKVRLLFY